LVEVERADLGLSRVFKTGDRLVSSVGIPESLNGSLRNFGGLEQPSSLLKDQGPLLSNEEPQTPSQPATVVQQTEKTPALESVPVIEVRPTTPRIDDVKTLRNQGIPGRGATEFNPNQPSFITHHPRSLFKAFDSPNRAANQAILQ
jgi:hypothetical protein